MKYSYNYEEAREADKLTMDGGVSCQTLMARAGKALADRVKEALTWKNAEEALFVCGGGNNGGDGFVAAQMLLNEGYRVEALCLAKKFSPDCENAKNAYAGTLYSVIPRRPYPVIVDCVFGTGLNRAPEGDGAALIEYIEGSRGYVISADIPSGLGENGVAFSPCVTADETVCMGLRKNALYLCDGADHAGKITVADIGVAPHSRGAEIWEKEDVAQLFPKRKSNSNKGTFGRATILAGAAVFSGAAFLASEACLKSGAGYTRLSVSDPVFSHAIGKLPACVLQKFHSIDGELLRSDCIAIGMGSGAGDRLYALLVELLQKYNGTLVIDADGLTSLADYGLEILNEKSCEVILTPHPKEFSRLVKKPVSDVLKNATSYAKEFAKRYNVTVILKNNRSVITDGTRTAINVTGSPCMAKGGSGDVLTGFLAGTCARGVPPFEAACAASYLMGKCGEKAEGDLGEYSVTASDLVSYIPKAILHLSE